MKKQSEVVAAEKKMAGVVVTTQAEVVVAVETPAGTGTCTPCVAFASLQPVPPWRETRYRT